MSLLLRNDVAKNDAFTEAALTYTEELVVSAEIVRLVPKMFRPCVSKTNHQSLGRAGVLTAVSVLSGA